MSKKKQSVSTQAGSRVSRGEEEEHQEEEEQQTNPPSSSNISPTNPPSGEEETPLPRSENDLEEEEISDSDHEEQQGM